jgi:hypothetical protein
MLIEVGIVRICVTGPCMEPCVSLQISGPLQSFVEGNSSLWIFAELRRRIRTITDVWKVEEAIDPSCSVRKASLCVDRAYRQSLSQP